jgi:DNA-binding CsgD family transcriptional regulator
MGGNPTLLEDRVFDEVKRLCYSGLDGTTLVSEAVKRLQRVVPFEAYCALTMDPLSGLLMHARAEEMGDEEEAHVFLERVYFEEGANDYRSLARSRRRTSLLSEATGGKLERSVRYRELTGPLGHAHELRGVFTVGRDLWGASELTRERGRPDFTPREVALLYRVAPHLGAGLRAAALSSESTREPEGQEASGVLVLDERGRAIRYTRSAERWLLKLEDAGSGWGEGGGPAAWREGRGFPAAVWNVVGALRRALDPETINERANVPNVCVRTRGGRWLTLQAALSEPQLDGRRETIIIIEPAGPKEMAWLQTAAYGLSSRERDIVELVVRGAPTKQIAAALYISEYTVQKHLSNVFEKVGVRNRQALVQRLFFDNVYPTLFT